MVPFVVSMALFEGGFGAGIGVGVAAMVRHDTLVYAGPSSSARVRISPFATPAARGVAMTVGF